MSSFKYKDPNMSRQPGMPEPMSRRVGYLLKVAQHALRQRMDDAMRPLGITAPQYAVLSAIELDPGISNARLARAAFVTPQTMHGIVANMERFKLIRRMPDPEHGRVRRSELTPKGLDILRKAHCLSAEIEAAMMRGMDKKDRNELAQLLDQCANNVSTASRLSILKAR